MNLRVIKKDVTYLVEEFLSDALIAMGFAKDEQKRETVAELFNEAIALRDTIYMKINNPSKENVKAYYRTLTTEFLTSIDSLFGRLGELNK